MADENDDGGRLNSWTMLRQSNLAHIATLVYARGAVSRAELTAAAGLNRQTVLDLVADLQGRGVLEESAPNATGRVGRPTRKLRLSGARLAVATLEIRPTRVRVAVATLATERITERSIDTTVDDQDVDDFIGVCARALTQVLVEVESRGLTLIHIAVGCAGRIDRDRGIVISSKYLRWTQVALLDRLSEASRIERERFSLSRLSNLAMKGEQLSRSVADGAGAGGGVVMLFCDLSIGVSGSVRHGERTVEGEFDPGAQFGHLIVERGGRACFCGRLGCLEQYVGSFKLAESLAVESRSEDDVEERLRSPGPKLESVVAEQGEWLARAIDVLAVTLGTHEIIFGGLFGLMLPHMREVLEKELASLRTPGSPPVIRSASRGRDGVLFGGFAEAIGATVRDPSALPFDQQANLRQ